MQEADTALAALMLLVMMAVYCFVTTMTSPPRRPHPLEVIRTDVAITAPAGDAFVPPRWYIVQPGYGVQSTSGNPERALSRQVRSVGAHIEAGYDDLAAAERACRGRPHWGFGYSEGLIYVVRGGRADSAQVMRCLRDGTATSTYYVNTKAEAGACIDGAPSPI